VVLKIDGGTMMILICEKKMGKDARARAEDLPN